MPDHPVAPPHANLGRFCVLSCLSALALGAGAASALPGVPLEPPAGLVLAQAATPDGQAAPGQQAQGDAPAGSAELADLNEVLAATQARLDELFAATAALAKRRQASAAIEQENQRLTAALREANAARAELEGAREQAEARLAELTKASDVAARENARLDKEVARLDKEVEGLRRENADLAERVAVADSARDAAQGRLEQTRSEMQAKLDAATGTAEQMRGELAGLRGQLKRAGQELVAAERAHEQAVARASELERSGAAAERTQAELATVKAQLGQAATAAIEAERARRTASSEAEQLRRELAQAHDELAAAKSDLDRLATANVALEEQVQSLRADSQTAMEVARRNLVVMEEKIEQLNDALAGAGLAAAPAGEAPDDPASIADEPAVAGRAPSGASAPDAPDADQGAEGAADLAAVGPAATASPDAGAELAKFNANIDYLNRRAMYAAGSNLFSGTEVAGDGVVHVRTTPAWEKIPAAGQHSYLNSLLDLWIVAQDRSGPAVVRIVDARGRVLLEKAGAVQDIPRE
jgi:hypothetical protein